MQIITIHLPRPVIEVVDKLVQMKLFPYRNTALRFIIQRGLNEQLKLISLINGDDPNNDNQFKITAIDGDDEKNTFISLKIPKALLALMNADMKRRGIRNRSEYIRQAILSFILDNMPKQ